MKRSWRGRDEGYNSRYSQRHPNVRPLLGGCDNRFCILMDSSLKNHVPPEAHATKRFSWARTKRKKTYAHNDSRAKYWRERCRILFGPNALRSVRTFEGDITTVELNTKFIEGL